MACACGDGTPCLLHWGQVPPMLRIRLRDRAAAIAYALWRGECDA